MGLKRGVDGQQRRMRMLSMKVDGTGTAALDGSDKNSASLTDNGTGDYTITYDDAYQRTPEVYATPLTTGIHCEVAASSTSSCQILCYAVSDGTTATDADFNLLIVGSDDPDAI